jgi:hypothetical protein
MVYPSLPTHHELRCTDQITHHQRWTEQQLFIAILLAFNMHRARQTKGKHPNHTAAIPIVILIHNYNYIVSTTGVNNTLRKELKHHWKLLASGEN